MKTEKTLQISIKAIPETGKDVSLDLGQEWFERWRTEDPGLEFSQGAIRGAVSLSKHGNDILVRGHLEGELTLACGRCLESYAAPLETDFDLLMVPGPWEVGAEEEELTPQDLDQDFYSGENVDLEAIIREQIILMLPLKPLCREDCMGLCPHCGANLNVETCGCPVDKEESPLANVVKMKEK